jgi:NDP-sugar pyrophosphorylase family protein
MMPARAFVLGAGLGTRLKPLTDGRPKPLVPIYGKPLITFAFDHLIASGVTGFVVNTHHCPEAYPAILGGSGETLDYAGCEVRLRHEPILLDTGGGIRNVADLIGREDFVVYNGDVLADFPLAPAFEWHARSGNLATLVLRSSGGPLQIRMSNETGLITNFRDRLPGTSDPAFLFTGISILSPEIFPHIPEGGILSIISTYTSLILDGARIGGFIVDSGAWFDLGSINAYLDAHSWLASHHLSYTPASWPVPVDPTADVDPEASLAGFNAVGPGARIGRDATLTDCVVWENARIAPHSELVRCIVRDGREASGSRVEAVI